MNAAVEIIRDTPQVQQTLRAAAYGRVSTDQESQELSYATQRSYYSQFISEQEGLEFAGFYGDEAKSGTCMEKRTEFNQMMADARAPKFERIYSKSISRFARNTLDALLCIRELKALNPPVYCIFEKEKIHTGESQSELILTVLLAIAQEESRSISENIKWSLVRKFLDGDPMVNLDRMLGYDKGWVINEPQAEIVRFIFERYAEGWAANAIAQELNAQGKTTVLGNKFRSDTVLIILRNEKYAGHLEMQKTITPNFLTHRSVKNTGKGYMVRNHHAPIIPQELFDKVQARLEGKLKLPRGGKESPAMNNLILPDGEMFCRMSYRAPATGYRDEEGRGSYYFQYPVWKTMTLEKVPNIDRCYMLELALQQSFMETLYQIKADPSGMKEEMEGIINGIDDPEELKIAMLDAEIEKTRADREEAEAKDTEAYAGLVIDLNKKIEQLQAQRADLMLRSRREQLRQEFAEFIRAVDSLPTVTKAGRLMVNTVDVDGSFCTEPDGSPIVNRLTMYHNGSLRIDGDRLLSAPDILPFAEDLYRKFIAKGVVNGDEVEYETTFGVKMLTVGNDRTLRGFLGWKKVDENGMVELLDETWKVNGRSMSRKGK